MLLNYIKLSFRLLIRNPFITIVNVFGLSLGFAVFFILWQYSQSELRTDGFHKDGERIVRLLFKVSSSSQGDVDLGVFPPTFAAVFQNDIEEIEEFTRAIGRNQFGQVVPDHGSYIFFSNKLSDHNLVYKEDEVIYVDPNYFQFFTFPFLYGSPDRVLADPNSVVISAEIARKYFGDEHPINKVLYLNDSIPLTVTGVVRELPKNTRARFDFFLSMNRIHERVDEWYEPAFTSTAILFRLKDGVDIKHLEKKIDQTFKNRLQEQMNRVAPLMTHAEAWLIPHRDMAFLHLKSRFFLRSLSILSLVILGMAWINYVNLSISTNSKRTKELGTRKAIGARPADFVKQFLAEAALINLISTMLAISIVQLVRKPMEILFNFYVPKLTAEMILPLSVVFVVVLAGVLITGIYPSMISIKRTPKAIFGYGKSVQKDASVSGVLTVVQYTSAIVLIVWFFSLSEQVRFILHKNVGIRTDQVVVVDLPVSDRKTIDRNLDSFLYEISQTQGVVDYTTSSTVADDWSRNWDGLKKEMGDEMHGVTTDGGVDERFIPFFGIKLIGGRNFNVENRADRQSVIVSVLALKKIGFNDPFEALGKKIFVHEQKKNIATWAEATVIGIIEDYRRTPYYAGYSTNLNNFGTMLTFGGDLIGDNQTAKISTLVSPAHFDQTIQNIQKLYTKYFPSRAFNWYFLEDSISKNYQTEKTSRNQILLFTMAAICIACLGLIGMMSQMINARTKEIGIRKVLGAQLHQIAQILLTTTAKQVLLSTMIGIPIAYYLINEYLEKYSERMIPHWWQYAAPVCILIFLLLSVVSAMVIKAGRSNPVDSLRYE